jgi:general secretion pathway protein A
VHAFCFAAEEGTKFYRLNQLPPELQTHMYLKHYGFKRQPFKLTSEPDFLWTGAKHQAALDVLKDGVLNNKGFILLTGEVGTGKSTLVTAFPKLNEIATITVTIQDPDMEPLDFCNFLANEFGMRRRFLRKEDFVRKFKEFLLRSFAAYKKVLVIIDEAQRLNHVLLEESRQLAAIEMAGRRLLKIFFVGQPEFCSMLMEDRNVAIRDEIAAGYNIEPLMPSEVEEYIGHRIKVAGGKLTIFTPEALTAIATFSSGFPRTINVLCDHCLLRGFEIGTKVVDASTVVGCATSLGLKPVAGRPEKFVFPFPLLIPEDEIEWVVQAEPKRLFKSLAAAVIIGLLLASGYLSHYFQVHEKLIQMVQAVIASIFP